MEHLIRIIQLVELKTTNINSSINEIVPYLEDAVLQINIMLDSEYADIVSQDMVDIVNDQFGKVKALAEISRFDRSRNVMSHQWVVAGTRIPTSVVWDYHEAGYTTEQILTEYPDLSAGDVAAAIRHERALRKSVA